MADRITRHQAIEYGRFLIAKVKDIVYYIASDGVDYNDNRKIVNGYIGAASDALAKLERYVNDEQGNQK